MPPRRSHLKSRHGCLTCKKRRVKCGEEHPKCNNCMTRQTDCTWPNLDAITGQAPAARDSSSSKSPGSNSLASTNSSTASSKRNVLELQLMHRWSTSTFESMVSEVSDDREIWRVAVPEVAIKYDFLLSSMFALTAFEMAHKNPSKSNQHISTALEFQAQAFSTFRNDLAQLEPEGDAHDALLYCSIILMVLALASSTQPALRGSMIDNTIVHFELVRGVSVIILKKPECIKAHPLFCNVPDLMSLPRKGYSERCTEAFRILNDLNESRAPSIGSETGGGDGIQADPASNVYRACKYGIWWLEYLTATCQESKLRGFLLSWISLAGEDFVKALKASDHIALLALMWWGVVLNPLGYRYWYGEEYGSTLAGEVVEMLAGVSDTRFEDLIRLADDEVGAGRAEAAQKPGSTIEAEVPVKRHYWEDASRLKDDGGLGNIPSEVMKYTSTQHSGFYANAEHRRQVRECLLTAHPNETDAVKDAEAIDDLAKRFDYVQDLNPTESSQALPNP